MVVEYLATYQRGKQGAEPNHNQEPSPKNVVICQQLAPRLMHDVMEETKLKQQAENKPEESDEEQRTGR